MRLMALSLCHLPVQSDQLGITFTARMAARLAGLHVSRSVQSSGAAMQSCRDFLHGAFSALIAAHRGAPMMQAVSVLDGCYSWRVCAQNAMSSCARLSGGQRAAGASQH